MLQAQITDEQREQLLRSIASMTAAFRQFAEACVPIVQAATKQSAQLTKALQDVGYLDEDGKPIEPPRMEITIRPDPSHVAEAIRDIRRSG